MPTHPAFTAADDAVAHAVLWLRLIVEVTGAIVIAAGLVATVLTFFAGLRASHKDVFGTSRLCFARYLALALELQLGADILSTAVSPSWDQLGKLGTIAVIRTGLNYFLRKELTQEQRSPVHVEVE